MPKRPPATRYGLRSLARLRKLVGARSDSVLDPAFFVDGYARILSQHTTPCLLMKCDVGTSDESGTLKCPDGRDALAVSGVVSERNRIGAPRTIRIQRSKSQRREEHHWFGPEWIEHNRSLVGPRDLDLPVDGRPESANVDAAETHPVPIVWLVP